MPKRLGSQMNLISTSPSSESSDQCLPGSSFFPETGSLCQSGGNAALTNLWAKYLSSPLRMRSASSIAVCGFQEMLLENCPSTAFLALRLTLRTRSSLRSVRTDSKKNFGEFCFRHCTYASGLEGI